MIARARKPGLAFAVDVEGLGAARELLACVGDAVDLIKVGLELFVDAGPASVRLGEEVGRPVFLDLKLHDIPETVDRAVGRAAALGAKFLTVHASGGGAMLERAAQRAAKEASGLTIVAVTVLTSLDDADLRQIGVTRGLGEQALALAALAWDAGVRAFVSSPREVATMRAALGPEAILITPGIRPTTLPGPGLGGPGRPEAHRDRRRRRRRRSRLARRRSPDRDAEDPRAAALALRAEIAGAAGRTTVDTPHS